MDNLFNLPFSSCFSLDDDPSNPVGWPADEAANKSPRPREGCPPSAWALDHRKKARTITRKSVFTCLLACLSCFFAFLLDYLLHFTTMYRKSKSRGILTVLCFFGHGRSPCSTRKTTYKCNTTYKLRGLSISTELPEGTAKCSLVFSELVPPCLEPWPVAK